MTTKPTLSFKDWEKLDLRVGKITKVSDHPNADKLYVLKVNFGEEIGERTIVAGLKSYCSKEHLTNKEAIFITNLEPATLRGVESQGMILAIISSNKSHGCIVTPDEPVSPGDKVS